MNISKILPKKYVDDLRKANVKIEDKEIYGKEYIAKWNEMMDCDLPLEEIEIIEAILYDYEQRNKQ